MIQAEVLNEQERPAFHGHRVSVAHIKTKHGVHTVESTIPEGATSEVVVASGYLAGGGYGRVVRRSAENGMTCRTVRHGNNTIRGAIEADADELAASIELLSGGRPVHLLAHSKGGRVALRAARRLDDSSNLERVTLVAPALQRTSPLRLIGGVVGGVIEHAACVGKMERAAKGFIHEVSHRGISLVSEAVELVLHDEGQAEDIEALRDRGVHVSLVHGSFDHLVPAASSLAAIARLSFDRIEHFHGLLEGGHNAILTSDTYVDNLLNKKPAA